MNQIEQLTLSVMNSFDKNRSKLAPGLALDLAFIAPQMSDTALMMHSANFPTYHMFRTRLEGVGLEGLDPIRLRGSTRGLVFIERKFYDDPNGWLHADNEVLRHTLAISLNTASNITRRPIDSLFVPLTIKVSMSDSPIKVQKYFMNGRDTERTA